MAAHRKSCWFDVRYKGTAPMSFDGRDLLAVDDPAQASAALVT
jgi:hypothetical protein